MFTSIESIYGTYYACAARRDVCKLSWKHACRVEWYVLSDMEANDMKNQLYGIQLAKYYTGMGPLPALPRFYPLPCWWHEEAAVPLFGFGAA